MGDDRAPTELAGIAEADTESVQAWGLDHVGYDDDDPPTRRIATPGRITTAAVVTSLAVTAVAAVVAFHQIQQRHAQTAAVTTQAPAAASPAPPPSPGSPKLDSTDQKFIDEMHEHGVPITDKDPDWTLSMAKAVCGVVHDAPASKYPPGTYTVIKLTDGILENNPGWTRQQAARFTNEAVKYYCPDVRGPSQQQITKMPPDARYLAMLQDRIGFTPVDNTLAQAGRQVCAWKQQGWGNDKIVDAIDGPSTIEDKQAIVETAIAVYCPE